MSTGGRHRIVPPLYFLAALLAMAGLHAYLPLAVVAPAPINLAGAVLVACGLTVALWAAGLFHVARTPIVPFRQSTTLVTSGVYAITRNPMYLGMVLVLLGVALLLGTVTPFLPIPLFVWQIRRKFVLAEEAFLEGLFGQQYVEYKARVRRWL